MVYSLISLYPEEKDSGFDENGGFGPLNDAVSCTITEEVNGTFELQMEYPISGRRTSFLENNRIITARVNPYDNSVQPFRIYSISKGTASTISVSAAHISYDMTYDLVAPFTAKNSQEAMTKLKANILNPSHDYKFISNFNGEGQLKITEPTPLRSVLGGSDDSILGVYGGEYTYNGLEVTLSEKRGSDNGVTIRYGKNLMTYKEDEIYSSFYTHIYPYWYDSESETLVTLTEKALAIPNAGKSHFQRWLPVDLSSEFQERPLAAELRAQANKYLEDNPGIGTPEVNTDITFVQLEKFEEYRYLQGVEAVHLGDTVTVIFPRINRTTKAEVTKTVYDVLNDRYSDVSIGTIHDKFTDTVVRQGNDVSKARTYIRDATKSATDWITNGRGYMVAVKDEEGSWMEICSLDKKNIDEAKNIWRWNNGGFGFSADGYDGPYTTAITQDGQMVADFVKAGHMSCNRLRGGTLTLGGGEDNVYGSIEVYSDTVSYGIDKPESLIARLDVMGLYLDSREYNADKGVWGSLGRGTFNGNVLAFYSTYSPPQSKIYVSSESRALFITAVQELTIGPSYSGDPSVGFALSLSFPASGANGDAHLEINGDVLATAFKSDEIVEMASTENYQIRETYSNVSTVSLLSDIGEAYTDDTGYCYVALNDIFTEAANTNVEYQVFLQKEGPGDLWVSEKSSLYFIVQGTENLKFSWEIKARIAGHEYDSLELCEKPDTTESIPYEYEYEEEIKQLQQVYFDNYNKLQVETEEYENETVEQLYGITY